MPNTGSIGTHNREILRGAAATFFLRILGIGAEFALQVFIARLLGASGAGVIFVALTVVTISSVVGRLGLDNAVLRFVSARAEIQDWAAVRAIAARGTSFAVAVTAVIAMFLIFSVSLWLPRLSDDTEAPRVMIAMLAAAPVFSALYILGEILKGLRKVAWSQFLMAAAPYLTAIALLPMLESSFGEFGVAIAWCAGVTGAALLALIVSRSALGEAGDGPGGFDLSGLVRVALPMMVVKISRMAFGWLATMAVAGTMSDADVGIFSAAMRTSLLLGIFLISVNSIAAPKFAALHQRGDIEGLALTARWSTMLLGLLTLPLFIVFLGFSGFVMSLFGPDFVALGGPVLVIFTLGQIVNILTGPVSYLLMMTGFEKDMRNATLIAFILCAASIWPLISKYGVTGAAVSVAASMAVMNILGAMFVRMRLGFFTLPLLPYRRAGAG